MPLNPVPASFAQRDSITPAQDGWRCDYCGEVHESQFDACWNCGAQRSAPRPLPPPQVNAPESNPQSASSRRRFRFRFGLRALLIAVAVLGTLLGIAGYKLQSYRYQKRIADSLARDGAVVEYRFGNVIGVNLTRPHAAGARVPITVDRIHQINKLKHLEWLHFSFTDLSGELLAELDGLDALQSLSLDCTNVTSDGIEKLDGFPNLQIISVLVTQLDDDTEARLREKYPSIYIEKLHLIDGRRVVDGYQ